MLDNMDRKFNVKGFSPKTKLDMWDMNAIADYYKKIEDDNRYDSVVKSR